MPAATDLDHVAIALTDRGPFWSVLAGDLGGRWVGGGVTPGGFAFAQLRFANGMKVEGLEPHMPEHNDFLVRFLAENGPGPHHLTFKVDDIGAALDRARSAGYHPLGIDLEAEEWKEAFLHPKQASGIVVQLAWSPAELDDPAPPWLPPPRVSDAAEVVHIAHAVADLEAALRLFKGLLGGRTVDAGAGGGIGWVDLAWPGPGRLRLLAGDPLGPWLDGRNGRLHHLALRVEDPGGVAGVHACQGWWELPAHGSLGTRLLLVGPSDPLPFGV